MAHWSWPATVHGLEVFVQLLDCDWFVIAKQRLCSLLRESMFYGHSGAKVA